jgi:hypothetical chaperone protein
LAETLQEHVRKIRDCAKETLTMAGLQTAQIDQVFFVGGSSLMSVVEQAMRELFPSASFRHANAFTAVADGLAIAADAAFKG